MRDFMLLLAISGAALFAAYVFHDLAQIPPACLERTPEKLWTPCKVQP